ncbi:MAG: hypothetical protein JEZ00_22210 [Anaerolineaceae bacterium]|nr:hypothetical protein [Anaerolineaceae bacterium]
MQKTMEKKEIKYFSDRNSGNIFSDFIFNNIHFLGSSINYYKSPAKSMGLSKLLNFQKNRTIIRNIHINQCEQTGCKLHGVIAENIVIDGLKTHNPFHSWATVYKHVTLKGKIGSIMISPNLYIAPDKKEKFIQSDFENANTEYYRNIDWALDIQEANFQIPIDIRGIPACLIKRDKDTQAVVKLEKAKTMKWKNIDLSDTPWAVAIDFLLTFGWDDIVLTVPKGSSKRRIEKCQDGIKKLRDYGIAELD